VNEEHGATALHLPGEEQRASVGQRRGTGVAGATVATGLADVVAVRVAVDLAEAAPGAAIVNGDGGVEGVATAVDAATIVLRHGGGVVAEELDPPVGHTGERGRTVVRREPRRDGGGPRLAAIARKRLVEVTGLRPHEHPQSAVFELDDRRLRGADVHAVVVGIAGSRQGGAGVDPRPAAIVGIVDGGDAPAGGMGAFAAGHAVLMREHDPAVLELDHTAERDRKSTR